MLSKIVLFCEGETLKINLNEILYAASAGLDAAENELLGGIRPGHCKRIAAISIMTGKALGLSDNDLTDLASFSILHDNSLTEVNQEELEYKKYNNGRKYTKNDYDVRRCIIGQNNTKFVPFRTNNRDVLLLHLENADGSGPFQRTFDRTPIKSQLIHLGELIDENFDLSIMSRETYADIIYFVKSNRGSLFSADISDTFTKCFKLKDLMHLSLQHLDSHLAKATRHFNDEYSFQEVRNMATLFARIVDFKQHYTCRHSIGVAENAEIMAKHYKFSDDKITRYYLAGALHDIGKLMISNEILQKPSKLSDAEFLKMKAHAYYTYEILSSIASKNMNDIVSWASHHHEKLNGAGYPFGLTADKLSMEERLMTCCDIYQALTEKRAYKDGFSHAKAISIMRESAMKGEIDNDIVNNMDIVLSNMDIELNAPTATLISK